MKTVGVIMITRKGPNFRNLAYVFGSFLLLIFAVIIIEALFPFDDHCSALFPINILYLGALLVTQYNLYKFIFGFKLKLWARILIEIPLSLLLAFALLFVWVVMLAGGFWDCDSALGF